MTKTKLPTTLEIATARSEPPTESFVDVANREIARANLHYLPESLRNASLPSKLPERITKSVPQELRDRLAALWRDQLISEREATEFFGRKAEEAMRDQDRAKFNENPKTAPAPRSIIEIQGELLARRKAIVAKFSNERGQEYFELQEAALPLVLAAIEKEARERLADDQREAQDLGLDPQQIPPDACSLALCRLYFRVQQWALECARLKKDWTNRQNSVGSVYVGCNSSLMAFLQITKPEV